MLNKIRTILHSVNKPAKRKIRILTWPTHEGYASNLGRLDFAEFHVVHQPGGKKWDFHTRNLPDNHYLYFIDPSQFRGETTFDFILSQERGSQLPLALSIRENTGIPVISLTHTEPYPNLSPKQLVKLKALRGDINLYITEHNKRSWGDDTGIVLPHGIDQNVFKGYHGSNTDSAGVTIVNQFKNRDVFCGWSLYEAITKHVAVKLIGENPGLSESINNVNQLVDTLASAKFYLNTSQLSPCPMSLLEAAMVGLPIITTNKQEIPKIFTHNVNCLMGETAEELIQHCQALINNPDLCNQLGAAARELMIKEYSIDKFVDNWRRVLVN